MIAALLGKKIGMTQVFRDNGTAVPVTVVQAGPCTVTQIKTAGRDGYDAVQLGYGDAKPHRCTLPRIGHALAAGTTPKRFFREVRLEEAAELDLGAVLTVHLFMKGEVKYVDVVGVSKGRGFAGGMKRHGFKGQPASHGTERKHRSPGSIGGHATDRGHGGNPHKGKRMAGRMGGVRVTVQNKELVLIDDTKNLLLIKGSVPGPNGGLVLVRKARTK